MFIRHGKRDYRLVMLIFFVLFAFTANMVYADIPAGKWKEKWDNTKKEFKKLTGKKKPASGKVIKISGIDKVLKKVDKTWGNYDKSKSQKDFNAFKEAVNKFSKKKNKYISVLKKAIDEAKKSKDAESGKYKKGLKILKNTLKEIDSSLQYKIKSMIAMKEAEEKYPNEDGMNIENAMAQQKYVTYQTAIENLKLAIRQIKTACSKLKAKPLVKTWKKAEMQGALRNMQNGLWGCEREKLDPQPPNGLKNKFIRLEKAALGSINGMIKSKYGNEKDAVLVAVKEIKQDVKAAKTYLKELKNKAKKLK